MTMEEEEEEDRSQAPESDETGDSSGNASDQTEQHALLTEWKGVAEADVEKDDRTASPPKKRRTRLFWIAVILISSSLVSLAAAASLFGLGATHESATQADGAVQPPNDYILNPQWDFEAPSRRREFYWTIRDHIHNPDGVYRPMILANNQFPGPLIEVNEGDTIVVHVDNQGINATAIHWHGIFQKGSPHMDGTVGVSQCPIAPGGKFTYEFTVAGQSGTYWWHGHHGMQASDGLYGPLVIHSRNEKSLQKIGYSSDRIVMVSDHYHDLSSALLWQYLMPDMENNEPIPAGGLLNGQNTLDCSGFTDRQCDNTTSNVATPILDVARIQKHRIRFINAGAFAEFQMQIDEHELAVTEVDGTDVEPAYYHRIKISPAQRYSVIMDASQSGNGLFWMRARMVTTCFKSPPKDLKTDVLAIVQYGGDQQKVQSAVPTSIDWQERLFDQCKDMNTSQLRPVEAISPPSTPDAFFYLRSNFEIGAYRLSRGFFNSSSWRPNVRAPSLIRSIDGLSTGNTSYSSAASQGSQTFINKIAFDKPRELVIQTMGIQTIDLMILNFDDGSHPLHLHGYKYFVLAQGHGYPDLTDSEAGITAENLGPTYNSLDLTNPLRRDTATVEGYGWILLRIVADNAGMWAFHCHVSWHSESGLLMQFLTRSDELAKMEIPTESLDLCSAEGLERGMAPDDAIYKDFAK